MSDEVLDEWLQTHPPTEAALVSVFVLVLVGYGLLCVCLYRECVHRRNMWMHQQSIVRCEMEDVGGKRLTKKCTDEEEKGEEQQQLECEEGGDDGSVSPPESRRANGRRQNCVANNTNGQLLHL